MSVHVANAFDVAWGRLPMEALAAPETLPVAFAEVLSPSFISGLKRLGCADQLPDWISACVEHAARINEGVQEHV